MELTAEQVLAIEPHKFRVEPDPNNVAEWIITADREVLDTGYEHKEHAKEMVELILEWRRDMLAPSPYTLTKEQEADAYWNSGIDELRELRKRTGFDFSGDETQYFLKANPDARDAFIATVEEESRSSKPKA